MSEMLAEAGRGGQKRAAGVPAPTTGFGRGTAAADRPRQYVEGVAGFRLLELAVDRRVLIPRPETEGLVELVLAWSRGSGKRGGAGPMRHPARDAGHLAVLEIGTGSGCIALSLASEGCFARIVATEVSPEALEVARANAAAVAPPLTPEWRLGSLFEPAAGERFDVIVSNPPYIAESEYAELDGSVRDFEPLVALLSGRDGLWHTRAILEAAGDYLSPGGLVALEVDSRRGDVTAQIARTCGWRDARVERDVFGRPRYLLARKDRW